MSKVTWKAGNFLYPLPAVMVSCGTMEKSNIITVAWTGILNTNPAMVYISVRPTRYSYNIIKEQKEYLKLFKNLEDLLNVLRGFNEFEFNDLNISEIEYVEYESGYKSLKTSTLNSKEEITNFNLKLIITDLINLDYLNDLLNNNPKNIFKIFKGEETIKLYSIYDEQLKKLNKDKIIDLEVFLENDNNKNLKICPSCDDIYPEDDNFCTEGCGELVKLTDYLSRKDLKTMILRKFLVVRLLIG